MSQTKRTTILGQIDKAAKSHTFIQIAENDEGKLYAKSYISIGGAVKQRWNKGEEMFYWPEYRLAASSMADLTSFAIAHGLVDKPTKGKTVTYGPVITAAQSPSGEGHVPAVQDIVLSLSGNEVHSKNVDSSFGDGDQLPTYRIVYTAAEGKKGESLTSTATKDIYSPEDFIVHDVEQKKGHETAKKAKSKEDEWTFERLAEYVSNPSTEKKSSRKTGSRSEALSFKNLREHVAAFREEKGDQYYMDVSNMNETGHHGKMMEANGNSYRALVEGDGSEDFIFSLKSFGTNTATKTGSDGLTNFLNIATGGDEAEAERLLKLATEEKTHEYVGPEKVTTKKGTKKTPPKTKAKTPTKEKETVKVQPKKKK